MSDSQLAERAPQSVKEYLSLPAYKARFGEVLGSRAPQFMASLISLTNDQNLARCEPKSVIASAMIAAVLDFPIEKSLGFAHIVPYGNVAQFQMAAKGYVQLALRSGQYQRLNAKSVNAEAFGGFDEVGEPRILWEMLDDTKPAVGYVVAWKLINGFTKVAYWSKAKIEDHASRFSQAYKKRRMDSPWFTNFDKMALKTVVMNELRSWGVLSVQMQTAMKHDMAAHTDVDAEPQYIDADEPAEVANQEPQQERPAQRPAPPARQRKGVAAAETKRENRGDNVVEGDFTDSTKSETNTPSTPSEAPKPPTPQEPPKETATPPEPAKTDSGPRSSLNDGEEISASCTVKAASGILLRDKSPSDGSPAQSMPCASVELSGDYNGLVYHKGGGKKEGDSYVPIPPWTTGAKLKVTLRGEAKDIPRRDANGIVKDAKGETIKDRKVIVWVTKVEAQPETPEVDMG